MSTALKDSIDIRFIEKLSDNILKIHPEFSKKQFVKFIVTKNYQNLSLKERVRKTSEALNKFIPGNYLEKLITIQKLAPQTRGLGGWIFPDFIQIYGLDHWQPSLNAIKSITEYFTGEFAIRVFIKKDPNRAMKEMLKWSLDKNYHVRRLASEGCRPRLPWSFKLDDFIKDPAPILSVLENLKNDESLYVRKSVANNLNDISKDHPELVLKLARTWIGKSKNTDWILKHALRTLLKRGDHKALKLFGLKSNHNIGIKNLKLIKSRFKIGTHFEFSFDFVNLEKRSTVFRLEYAVHYLKKNKSYSKKVFKISEREYLSGSHNITRKHSLRQMTTRKHNPGLHHIDIIINGLKKAQISFTLHN